MVDLPAADDLDSGDNKRLEKNTARASRRNAVNKTIRSTRETLTSATGHSLQFDRDMLITHANNVHASSLVLAFLTVLIGLISTAWLDYFLVLLWTISLLLLQFFNYTLNSKLLKIKVQETEQVQTWRNRLLFSDLLIGVAWSLYLAIPVAMEVVAQPVFAFSSLLIVIALYAFITAPLTLGVFCATTPIAIMLFTVFFTSSDQSLIMMAVLFICAQLFFILVSKQVERMLHQVFTIKAEKDDLIVELEHAKSVSEDSRRRAEAANLAKSRFLATMSHELRTPLNAILGFSEIIKGEILGPLNNQSYKEYITDIHSSGQHLLNLINEILDLSRIEAGKFELSEQPVNLCEVVEDCESLLELRAKNKSIRVKVVSEPTMTRIWGDERAIRQIVLNLLSNAIKFTPQGGEVTVQVGWTAGGGQYVSIADNGPGIPKDEIPLVLSQFGQGSIAIKSAEQGTGLGLPIVQALVNMHGGTFSLESELRVGTKVTFSIPQNRIMQALEAREASSTDSRPPMKRVVLKRTG